MPTNNNGQSDIVTHKTNDTWNKVYTMPKGFFTTSSLSLNMIFADRLPVWLS